MTKEKTPSRRELARRYGVPEWLIARLSFRRLLAMSEEARAVMIATVKNPGVSKVASAVAYSRIVAEDRRRRALDREAERRRRNINQRVSRHFQQPDLVQMMTVGTATPRAARATERVEQMLELASLASQPRRYAIGVEVVCMAPSVSMGAEMIAPAARARAA